jgi:hypothetical protein
MQAALDTTGVMVATAAPHTPLLAHHAFDWSIVVFLLDRGMFRVLPKWCREIFTRERGIGYVRAVWLSQSPLVSKFPLKTCNEGNCF